ncbi:diguanylate cyclase [Nodosilinea sp. P-1105]|uniref:sensor domain-containing diguanylate cyclase n=1 Tax=Nodosilinea sp. P-1105 TaxID=2546229 RepID=UPI00146EA0F5|nr:diguanylate cyclase [Nodosilinea sp. P-1105]NMF82814.1 diguanylate cyclase [Nodosilinea sp. P-1105]
MVKGGLPAEYQAFQLLQTPIWIYQLDPFTLLWANPAAATLGPDATLAAHLNRLNQRQPNLLAQRLAQYQAQLSQGNTIQETVLDDQDPEVVGWTGTGLPLGNGGQGLLVEGHLSTWAAQTTAHQASTHRAMVEATPDLLMRMNRQGMCLDLITGGNVQMWQGVKDRRNGSIYDFLPAPLGDLRIEYVRRCLDTGQRQIYQQDIAIEDALRHEEVRIVPMQGDEVLVLVRDVTQSVVAKAALCKQAETLQAVFDNIPLMLSIFDAQGRIEYINQAMEAELGWSLAEWQQQDLMIACYPDPAYRQAVLEHIQRANGQWRDLKTHTAAGDAIDVAWANIRLSDGRIIGIGQNICDRKRTERQFQHQAQRDRLMAQVTQRISQSLDLQDVLNQAVVGLHQILEVQRVLVYALDVAQGGRVVAESVSQGYGSIQGRVIVDHCFHRDSPIMAEYRQGRCQITADIYTSGLADCYVNALAQIQVRANLAIPIIQDDRVWGLLTCQQCDRPRQWQPSDIDMLTQLANHLAIAIQQSELYHKLQQANQELQHLATHDKLTGLPNRRYFDDYLEQEWRRLSREQAPLGLIFCDIDYFKQYNDAYGHLVGDDCLVVVAQAITRSIKRPADLTARYGGEEFAVILPNTDMAGVIRAAQRIRREIEAAKIPHRTSLIKPYITLSMGLACWHPAPSLSPDVLKAMADQALYQAKQAGRDRYCLPSSSPP